MRDWLTYRLSDLLMFSPRTYYRMIELYHREIWPAQIAAIALVVALVVMLRRDDAWRTRAVAAILAAAWLWVGVMFHIRRYSSINWAANYFGALFVVQAALVTWIGVVRGQPIVRGAREASSRRAWWLVLAAVTAPPLLSRIAGRSLGQLDAFALTPDATAVGTIAALALAPVGARRALLLVPLAWCVIGGATLWAMGSAEAWMAIVAAVAGLIGVANSGSESRL